MDCSEYNSFLCRLDGLVASGFFEENEIDTVLVFGGTNDSWADAPLGAEQYADWKKEDLYFVLPAGSCFLKRLTEQLPKARIVCMLNDVLKPEITEGFEKACRYYGVESIRLADIDKISGHPTIKGMAQIAEQLLAHFNKQ